EGALWRSVPPRWQGGGRPLQKRLGSRDIARIFRRRGQCAQLECGALLTGHSTRVGAAQDLDDAGFTALQIQRAGGWKSETMVARYTKEAKVKSGAMAQLQSRRRVRSDAE
ncbi:MAG: tyrosine-type recombinase/integrase, partial [Nevskiales bacterium]